MPQHYDPNLLVDLRSRQVNPPAAIGQDGKPKARYATAKGKVVERKPESVKGLTVHQTAVTFGVSKAQVKAAGGDAELAKHLRMMSIPAHAIASQSGKFVVHCPLSWYAYHGHGFNEYSLGLEMEALLPGLKGKDTWNKKPATVITPEFIAACRSALGYLYEEGRKEGMPLEFVWAHRQSTAKPSDPGEELWQLVVEEFAVPVLKLKPQYDLKLKDRSGNWGKPIPLEWSPNGVGHY